MTIRSLYAQLLGVFIIFPFFVVVKGAPIFYAQIAIIFFGLLLYVCNLPFHPMKTVSFLDQLVLVYLFWIFFSLLLSVVFQGTSMRPNLLEKQMISLANLLLVMSPYLVGRHFFNSDREIQTFQSSIATTFCIGLLGCGYFYYLNINQLYIARHTIAQRIPMIIALISWGICARGFWSSPRGKKSIFLWFVSMVIIVLSLTRAVYLQWFISGIVFIYIGWAKKKNRVRLSSLFVVTVLVVFFSFILVQINPALKNSREIALITDRFTQMISFKEVIQTDESASVRVEIWSRLTQNILDSPEHLLIGFGQLGPSYIGKKFTSLSGELISGYSAHSQYLDSLIRMGVIGLLLELLIISVVIARPLVLSSVKLNLDFFQAHSAALVGLMVYGIFHETLRWQMFGFYFWLYAGMMSAQLYRPNRPSVKQ